MDKSLHKMGKIAYGLRDGSLPKPNVNPATWKEPP